ncbi:SPOR domain-containing protein [Flavobacterium jejuense]|uniref:SPOR domain-containing protein n=1 Tax=Flavobacterium jejuense TaxID=1544455 RepID=A0ABX0ISU9_9FLAO|nr:SPOR domain-containing protein [Flavobacterium jejuense]NHN26960.1 SPOR domain-containing protein [Flavobacterium jejuense]
MLLDKYISELLYRYQCVTVPGFGAFVTEVQSANVSGSASTFMPPRKVILFNSNIKNNDGLLANHIALSENSSYENVVVKIASVVNSWISALENKNKVTLENIGEIYVNGEYNWVFQPYTEINYLVSSFGLNSFVSPEMKREKLLKEVQVFEAKEPVVLISNKKRNYGYLKYAAAVTLFLGAGLSAYKIHYDQQVATDTLMVKKEVQREVQNRIQQATFFIDNPITTVELAVKEEKRPYHLVAGAFRSEDNAEKAQKLLIEQGYQATILEKNKYGLIPVAYGSFKMAEEAELLKTKLFKEDSIESWILID